MGSDLVQCSIQLSRPVWAAVKGIAANASVSPSEIVEQVLLNDVRVRRALKGRAKTVKAISNKGGR